MKIKALILSLILAISFMGGINSANVVQNSTDYLAEKSVFLPSLEDDVLYDHPVLNEPAFNEERVSCTDSERVIRDVVETFNFSSTTEIDEVVAVGDIDLLHFEIKGDRISCTLSDFAADESITLKFYCNNILIDQIDLYFTLSDMNTFYSSAFSLDTAKRNAGKKLNYELVPEDEVTDASSYDNKASLLGTGASGSISGTFEWTDDQNNTHPLIGAKVEITIDGSQWSDITYTNQLGFYSFTYNGIAYNGSGKPKVTVYADNGESVYVANGGIYAKSKEFSGNSGTFSYTFSPVDDGDMGKAMIIFQAAKNFSDYAKTMNDGIPVETCPFYYPGDPNDVCYYNGSAVVITSKSRKSESYPHSYSAWDVIGHEYGHHIQHCYGITANPGGPHGIPSNNIDDQYGVTVDGVNRKYTLGQAKDRGLKLAWGEGWPTYWSTVAQSTFSDDLKTILTVGDTSYTSYNGLSYDLDSYDGLSYGDADERAIQRILYKLYTSTTDAYDKFSIGADELWNIVVENKACTFYEFINDLYDAGYNKNDLGKILAEYNVVADAVTIDNSYLDECPVFAWSTYMGSSNLRYNNFDLVFLNTRGQEILRINNIVATGETGQYTLTRSEWAEIISADGRIYYAYIVCRQTLSYISGNYCSELFQFTEPDDFNNKVQIKPDEWGFEPQYFFENNKEGHTSTTITDHGLTITTERLRCGYIENSYVVLSPKREDAGLAYLELTFDKPIYSYMFGIALWSNNEGLFSSTCTAVVEVMDKDGNWTVDWDLFSDLPNGFSTKSQQIDRYETAHPEGIYGIRFVMTAPATGDRNKGRLCIDDIVLNTDPDDLWFISTFYE